MGVICGVALGAIGVPRYAMLALVKNNTPLLTSIGGDSINFWPTLNESMFFSLSNSIASI